MLWLEKYCRDNPLSNLEMGMYKLASELRAAAKAATPAAVRVQPATPKPVPAPPPAMHELPLN